MLARRGARRRAPPTTARSGASARPSRSSTTSRRPTFIVGGLDDIFQRGEPMLYERLADHTDARLLIGPWTHIAAGTGLPRDGVPVAGALLLQWFDQHVLGLDTGAECIPPVTQYVRGHERYESAPTWPVPDLAAERWHLRGDGGLTAGSPARREARPLVPPAARSPGMCTRSTAQWLIGAPRRARRARPTTGSTRPRLAHLHERRRSTNESVINGPIQADLWITTTRPTDAVVSVAVSDVAPDGTSRGLTNGLLSPRTAPSTRARSGCSTASRSSRGTRSRSRPTQARRPGPADAAPGRGVPDLRGDRAGPPPAHHGRALRRAARAPADPGALDALGGPVTVLSDAAHPSSVVLPVVAKR